VFVGGLLWKRVNSRVAFITLLLAFPMFVMPYLLRILSIQMNVFNVAGFVLLITIGIFILLTLGQPVRETDEGQKLVWKWSMVKLPEEIFSIYKPWYRNLVFWGGVMVLVYVLIYIKFW
jgi:hypothetical protein